MPASPRVAVPGWVQRGKKMTEADRRLIEKLADGRFHSGQDLARLLGVSRAAVWKRLRALAGHLDLEVQAVRGRGYRLARPLELLHLPDIEVHIDPDQRARLAAIELFDDLPSTSRYLSEGASAWGTDARVCLAERQSEGRGRRGRAWISPFAANLYLSLYWHFELPMAALNGLSLGAGVAAARALERAGLGGVGLKWPNDIHHDEKKLGGILVEVLGQPEGPVAAVIGIGLNVHMPESAGGRIDQEWTDLNAALRGEIAGARNRLAGLLIDELVIMVQMLAAGGWPDLHAAWKGLDPYVGREVVVLTPTGSECGRYLGVDRDGALLLASPTGPRAFHAGEVSLRTASDGSGK